MNMIEQKVKCNACGREIEPADIIMWLGRFKGVCPCNHVIESKNKEIKDVVQNKRYS